MSQGFYWLIYWVKTNCKFMRSFSIFIIIAIVFISFLYVVMNFMKSDQDSFSTNISGNVSGRDGATAVISPVGVFKNVVGIK